MCTNQECVISRSVYLPGVCTYVLTQVLVHTYVRTYICTCLCICTWTLKDMYLRTYTISVNPTQPTPNMPSREVGLAVVIDIIPEGWEVSSTSHEQCVCAEILILLASWSFATIANLVIVRDSKQCQYYRRVKIVEGGCWWKIPLCVGGLYSLLYQK